MVSIIVWVGHISKCSLQGHINRRKYSGVTISEFYLWCQFQERYRHQVCFVCSFGIVVIGEKGLEKVSFPSSSKEGQCQSMSKLLDIMLILHASKVMFKILQARLQQYVNWELLDVQIGLRKGRGTRDQIANICWIIEKIREFQKNICFIDCAK